MAAAMRFCSAANRAWSLLIEIDPFAAEEISVSPTRDTTAWNRPSQREWSTLGRECSRSECACRPRRASAWLRGSDRCCASAVHTGVPLSLRKSSRVSFHICAASKRATPQLLGLVAAEICRQSKVLSKHGTWLGECVACSLSPLSARWTRAVRAQGTARATRCSAARPA